MNKRIYPVLKRVLDVVGACSLLAVASPFLVGVACAIKLTSPGPIFFKQQRYGKGKKPFQIYKFRTMYCTAPSNTPTAELENPSQHITSIGNFLRRTSIDELPQLWNVAVGEMSFIGPRPVILEETDLIVERDKYGANDVLPGISGWAQVNGRDTISNQEKARLDGEYVQKMSLLFDAKSLLQTFVNVVKSKDIKMS